MAQRITPTTVIIPSSQGEGHLRITLELNINLTSDGGMHTSINAVTQKDQPKEAPAKEEEEDFVGFEIPSFEPTQKINFGNKVDD